MIVIENRLNTKYNNEEGFVNKRRNWRQNRRTR